jgi:hypothetical protein
MEPCVLGSCLLDSGPTAWRTLRADGDSPDTSACHACESRTVLRGGPAPFNIPRAIGYLYEGCYRGSLGADLASTLTRWPSGCRQHAGHRLRDSCSATATLKCVEMEREAGVVRGRRWPCGTAWKHRLWRTPLLRTAPPSRPRSRAACERCKRSHVASPDLRAPIRRRLLLLSRRAIPVSVHGRPP